jgi:branched-chain amino acid transport system permease protein
MTRSGLRVLDYKRHVLIALIAAVFLSAPMWAVGGTFFLMGILAIQIAFAVSFNMIFGLAGLVSFGHAAYFAVGAYASAALLRDVPQLPFLVSILAAGTAAGAVGAIVGLIALRRASGIYFAILTLALGELVHVIIAKTTYLGREDGFTGIPRPAIDLIAFRLDTANPSVLYLITLIIVMALIAGLAAVWYGPLGRAIAAARQDSERATFLGIDVARLHLFGYILATAAAGLAGGLYAPWAQLITPEIARWTYSAIPILFCLLGGAASFWGPVLGGIVFVGLEHATRTMIGLQELIVGGVLLGIVLGAPGGLTAGLSQLEARLARRKQSKKTERVPARSEP